MMEEKKEEKRGLEHHSDSSSEHHKEHPVENKPEHHSEHHPEAHHSEKVRKRINWKRVLIVLGIIIIILGGLYIAKLLGWLKPQQRSQILTLDYKIYVDNRLVDENTANYTKGFVSSALELKSDKLDKEIASMAVGDTKTIILEPKDAYGDYNSALVHEVNRTEKMERKAELNKTVELTIDRFSEIFNEQPILNKEYSLSSIVWKYKVIYVDNETCKIEAQAKVGDKLASGITGVDRIVTQVTTDTIVTMLQGESQVLPVDSGTINIYFDDTYIYFKMNPSTEKPITLGEYTGYVTKLTEDKITIDENNPYAGKTVRFEVKLVAISQGATLTSKQKIPGAPTMQVFIMSYCPYGIQMLKGLLPVWKEFDDKANIELRFVSYTMHGAKEDEENARMICIREEQYSKLIPYLECFTQSSDAASCMSKVAIDESAVSECMKNKAAGYMEVDKKLNTQYGVQGSPTVVIDGKEVNIYPRDPQSIADALCKAFKTKPSECSLTFSTQNPSPGFGGGSSSSSSGGSCG